MKNTKKQTQKIFSVFKKRIEKINDYQKIDLPKYKDLFIKEINQKKANFLKELEKIRIKKIIDNIQNNIENIFSSDDNQVVLSQSKHWAQAITWILIGSTTTGIAWISIAKTEEIVIATGKLEPKGGVIDVQMPLEGIAKEILVKEGEKVKKGQVLINLDTDVTDANNQALKKRLAINISIQKKLELLLKEGAIPEIKYLEQEILIEDLKAQLKTNQVRLGYQQITSPANGLVFDLQPKGPGYVARTSEPVLKIIPSERLIAKVEIDNRTIGFVTVGKSADISIDSFPASDFGVIKGSVSKIGSDALPPIPSQGKGYRFPADISLEDQFLTVKNGQKLPLQTGMSLTANIKLRKATYLQLLLSKFVDKLASLKSI